MADGITRIAVEGFKSIATRQEIEIAPLTVLAGANSSGKSSIMQPLLLLKQTLEATYDPGPLKIDGPNIIFTSSDEFLSKMGSGVLAIELATNDLRFGVSFRRRPETGMEIEETRTFFQSEVTLRPNMPSGDLCRALSEFIPFKAIAHQRWSVKQSRFFLNLVQDDLLPVSLEYVSPYIQDVIHVPALRGGRSRAYPVAAPGPRFPGTFDNYTGSVILAWQKEKSRNYESLNEDIRTLGLAKEVYAHRPNEVSIELFIGGLVPGSTVNIADVGFGVSQVLPVLVALRAADQGRLVYLEEPEVDLHPLAQTKLADVLADAAKRGVRVVAETHSTLLLTAIQTLVAKGELPRELVKLHWFQRDPKTGITQVTTADLDENGAFGDWPEDFDKVILDAEGAYLDAVEGRQVR